VRESKMYPSMDWRRAESKSGFGQSFNYD
jgi:hypothetical protein